MKAPEVIFREPGEDGPRGRGPSTDDVEPIVGQTEIDSIDQAEAGGVEPGDDVEPRTAAATAARRRKHAEKLATSLGPRIGDLPDAHLRALTGVLFAACAERGLTVPDLR
ncbi:hypothetical protein Dvina_01405 [Dactylosporangium vinaceum]|uniref:Uncharacterized protein n=1 Tax=Dactylosporangium vinaceum TaxID=53362 RepID=A0ABV5MLM3_9ACTN|nr:hypothetical protein [Dactylosporangium vinaceum]UAB96915.1 hypothetical protein Dvina_01405 [Dactylosporangium vinaceum]